MKTNSTTTVTQSLTLSGKDIITLLNKVGVFNDEIIKLPMKVVFQVPGGGDYSNTDVEFEKEEWVKISWTTHSTLTAIQNIK
ncbi:MAG: hypothetical protein CTY12_00760 [Methylotenera sp.]|nr:MAG: hypothetical protein CTY12_00760 [Methylotenera sp.]